MPTSITDFDGNTTTFVLDSHGNVLEEEQPGGVDQEWTYNSAGQVLTYTDADGATTTYTYDDLGRLTEIQEPGPGSPTIDYAYVPFWPATSSSITDPDGNLQWRILIMRWASRRRAKRGPGSAGKDQSTYTYDADGNLLRSPMPMGIPPITPTTRATKESA